MGHAPDGSTWAALSIDEDLGHWVNDGLMAFFFYLVGLEIRRELSLGELRDRRAAAIPVVAALAGMAVPALLYVAVNAGGEGARRLGDRDGHRHRLRAGRGGAAGLALPAGGAASSC